MNRTNSIALGLIAIGIFYFLTKPMIASLADLSAKKDEYQTALDKLNSLEELKKTLSDKMNSLSDEQKQELQTLLPDDPGTVKLVSDIDSTASKYGISIDKISTAPVNSDSAASVADAAPAKNYNSELINFSFSADYPHLKSFLNDLESSLRLVDIRYIELNTGNKGGVNDYKVSAEIYWLNSKPA